MEFEARDASQAAQQANVEFYIQYEELVRQVIQVWGPDAEFDYSNIGEMLGYSEKSKTVKGGCGGLSSTEGETGSWHKRQAGRHPWRTNLNLLWCWLA